MPVMHTTRQGAGPPVVLVHGLGSDSGSWAPILEPLARHREVVAVDLPGHGRTPALEVNTVAAYADALERHLRDEGLADAALVGSSLGARLVLELARRGTGGPVVALDPGGFWGEGGARYLGTSLAVSARLVRALDGQLPALLGNPITRTALMVQLSARPWALDPDFALEEVRKIARTPVFGEVLSDLAQGPRQQGMALGTARHPIVIGWGRRDRVTLRRQADQAREQFPDATIHRFDHSGHFPAWDAPEETAALVLATSEPARRPGGDG